jgi:predicted component of type VI protein secretion system
MIQVDNGKISILDTSSSGETKVNGSFIETTKLRGNESIRVGQTELSLVEVESTPKASPGGTLHSGKLVSALLVKKGTDTGKCFILSDGDNFIGRTAECNIQLTDDSISRKHALIRNDDGKLSVIDFGSSSGTKVEGHYVRGNTLQNGDQIQIGRSGFTLMAPYLQSVTT